MRTATILSTSRPAPKRNKSIAHRRFGGINLYAYGDDELYREIENIRSGILSVVQEKGPLAPSLVRYLVANKTNQEIPQRVFSALLGAELRSGRLDCIVCESETKKPFRIVIAAAAKLKFEILLKNCLEMISSSERIMISTIRDRLYPGEDQGNWTRAYYLASRLARVGLVDFLDRFSVKRAKDAYHAISGINDPLYVVDLFRLD
jgi:hypothetical protein